MENNETVKDRLLIFLKSQNISKAEFARKMGLSVAYVSAMRKSLPEDRVKRLCGLYPSLNRDWLLYGEGDMLLDEHSGYGHRNKREFLIPLLPVQAFAGSLQEYSCGVQRRDCDLIASPVNGADLAIPISGDSMEPEIHDGTIAALKRINERAFIPWGNPMVIDTENGVLLKVVYPSKMGKDYIEAHSYNPRYPDIQIPTSSILGLYRVVAYMRRVSTM